MEPAFGAGRDDAWERLEDLLAKAAQGGDIRLLLSAEAVAAARDLAAATDPTVDLDAACSLASYHWNRYLILPRRADRVDFAACLRYFGLFFPIAPNRVPDRVRSLLHRGLRRGLRRADLRQVGDRVAVCFAEHQRTGSRSPLLEAAALLRVAVEATPVDDLNYTARRSNLAAVLLEAYQTLLWPDVLLEARDLTRSLLDALAEVDPDRVTVLINLGSIQRGIYEFSEDLDDLREAETRLRQAAALAGPDDPSRPLALTVLGYCLRTLFERGDEPDVRLLLEALDVGRQAADSLADDHPLLARALSNLSLTQWIHALRTDDATALKTAVATGRRAVQAAPRDSTQYAAMLSNLGGMLLTLFQRSYDADVLAEAVSAGREAVAAIPVGHLLRARHEANLAFALAAHADLTGESVDLEEAVAAGERAMAAVAAADPARGAIANNLVLVLSQFYERTGEIDALMRAFDRCDEAVRTLPVHHPVRVSVLSNAAAIAHSLYELYDTFGPTGVAEGLAEPKLVDDTGILVEAAVELGREAVSATAPDHPDRAKFLCNLAVALHALHERAQQPELQTEAVDYARQAVEALAPGHPDHAMYLTNLGSFLSAQARRTGSAAPLAAAYAAFAEACENTAGSVDVRIKAYRRKAALDLESGQAGLALAALEEAIALTQLLAPRSLTRIDRERQLRRLAGLPAECCSAALAAGRPQYAVELLEQTRGLLAADRVDAVSSDLARLRVVRPNLAEEVEALRDRVDAFGAGQPGFELPFVFSEEGNAVGAPPRRDTATALREAQALAAERRAAHAQWTGLVERIRALDGFADFLRAPRFADLADAASDGPVVFLCAGRAGGNALIITSGAEAAVRVVELPALDEDTVLDRAAALLAAVAPVGDRDRSAAIAAQEESTRVLAWLWDAAAQPVLSALGLLTDQGTTTAADATDAPPARWPRVWWCPVGVLAFLPIHAAQRQADAPDGPPGAVMDCVVSSYTATLRALTYARARAPHSPESTALVVSVSDAAGQSKLEHVKDEAKRVAELLPGTRLLADPTQRAVLDALPEHRIAHFACHASANARDPGASRLLLADHAESPLTVRQISALRLTADLAYLSACETAVTSAGLADEPVHVTGAFQLAGYRSVIGTLWPVSDLISARLTEGFYRGLTENGTRQPATDRAAAELHHAIRALRTQFRYAPAAWAGYIHTGV